MSRQTTAVAMKRARTFLPRVTLLPAEWMFKKMQLYNVKSLNNLSLFLNKINMVSYMLVNCMNSC